MTSTVRMSGDGGLEAFVVQLSPESPQHEVDIHESSLIQGWVLFAGGDGPGSATVGIYRVMADGTEVSITGDTQPTVTDAWTARSSDLVGWDARAWEGDPLRLRLLRIEGMPHVSVQIDLARPPSRP